MTDRRGDDWGGASRDLDFEEFQLGEPHSQPQSWETSEHEDSYPHEGEYVEYEETQAVSCPSCAAVQPSTNRHCEECGAQLATYGRTPVAPAPLPTLTAGSRALAAIAVVLAVVIGLALIFLAIRGNGDGEEPTADTTTESTISPDSTLGPTVEISPISITCSSEYNDERLSCNNLIDGDTSTYWNDNSLQGDGATFTVTFPSEVALTQVQFFNVEDNVTFRRNFRVRSVQIYPDSAPGAGIQGSLNNVNSSPQVVSTPTAGTTQVHIEVTSTWPSEAVGGNAAFEELALAEIKFWGHLPANGRSSS